MIALRYGLKFKGKPIPCEEVSRFLTSRERGAANSNESWRVTEAAQRNRCFEAVNRSGLNHSTNAYC